LKAVFREQEVYPMAPAVKALFFDVFGTLVDWRMSVAREAEAILKPLGHTLDWHNFADRWRGKYQGAMEQVRSGRIAFCKLDVLHRQNLEGVLSDLKLSGLSEEVLRNLNLAWHRLDAWPDVTDGLARLKRRYWLAPVSNGNISLMVDLARRNGFVWDAILGAEIAHDYKPQPRAYLAAAEAFDLAPRVHDGRSAQLRLERRRGARLRHGSHRASQRSRARQG
jgi:2-haloacid dehalogenase